MTSVAAPSVVVEQKEIGDLASALCPVCPHPAETHDEIGLRYCGATVAGAWRRACVCVDSAGRTLSG